MLDAPDLLVPLAPADLPPAPGRAAWRALPYAAPRAVTPAPGACAVIVQPYFSRQARERLQELSEPAAHANLAPARRCRQGFKPGLMQVQRVLHRGLSEPTAHDLFPYLGPGAEIEACVEGMRLTPDRLQAELQLNIDGARVTVFDAYFTQARSVYQLARRYRFEVTALACRLAPTDAGAPLRLRPARRASTRISAELRSVKPQAVILLDEPLTRMTLRTWVGSSALNLPTLAHASQLAEGWTPRSGEAVAGRVWLQAQLIEPA